MQHPDPDLGRCLVDTNGPKPTFNRLYVAATQLAKADLRCLCKDDCLPDAGNADEAGVGRRCNESYFAAMNVQIASLD